MMLTYLPDMRLPDLGARRRARLQELADRIEADLVAFHRLVRRRRHRDVVIGGVDCVGPDGAGEAFARFEGRPYQRLDIDVAAALPTDAFEPLDHARTFRPGIDVVLEELGMEAAIGGRLSDGDRTVGDVTAYRLAGRPSFTGLEARVARDWVQEAPATSWDPVEHADLPGAGHVVCDPDGRVRYSSLPNAEAEHVAELLTDAVVSASNRGVAARRVLGRTFVAVVPMGGPGGGAVMLELDRVDDVPIPPILRLSPLKRRIIAYAVEGATVPEMARAIERSPETVRSHLRRIYEVLDVGTRVELAALCRDLWS